LGWGKPWHQPHAENLQTQKHSFENRPLLRIILNNIGRENPVCMTNKKKQKHENYSGY